MCVFACFSSEMTPPPLVVQHCCVEAVETGVQTQHQPQHHPQHQHQLQYHLLSHPRAQYSSCQYCCSVRKQSVRLLKRLEIDKLHFIYDEVQGWIQHQYHPQHQHQHQSHPIPAPIPAPNPTPTPMPTPTTRFLSTGLRLGTGIECPALCSLTTRMVMLSFVVW